MNTQSILDAALHMPATERAALAEQLLASLDNLPATEIECLWLTEAARRAMEIDQGQVTLISADQVRHEALTLCR